MAQIKSYTDLEQSKVLAKILPLESVDMHYHYCFDFDELESIPTITEEDDHFVLFPKDVRCWSIAALINVLPKNIKSPFGEINPFVGQINIKDYRCVYLDGDWGSNIQTFADNPIDACYEMILKLNELKMF